MLSPQQIHLSTHISSYQSLLPYLENGRSFDIYHTVPEARAALFRKKFGDGDQVRAEAGKYYALYKDDPSWKVLSVFLYGAGEIKAVEIAKPHVQTVTDPSLTRANILQVTRHVPLWGSEDSYENLDMPESQHKEIVKRFSNKEEAKQELFTTWLAGHPYPSWEHVRSLLRHGVRGEVGKRAAQEVEERYIKMTLEKARQILEAALQDGYFPLGYLKSMAVGVARSGKTLSKNHVFKMKYDPNCSISTGVCEAPIFAFRQLTLQLIKALPSAKGFDVLKYEDINQLLADLVRKGLLKGSVAKVVKKMVQAASKGSSFSDRSEGVAAASSVGTGSGDSGASTAVVSAVCADSKAWVMKQPLFKLQIILFLDSGGQPQFHEVVAAFSHNVSLVLVFIKLNERLDALVTNAFTDEEGEWFTEQCPSLLTNEQMVVQFVHTMMCKPVAGMHTRFMVIGTHRDLMHECDETLAQKNERLASLFLPALEEHLVMNGNDIIFAVNAKNPDKDDEKCFDLIREKVADLSGALDVDTPIAFLALMNDVNKYAKEQRKKVVSMEECQTIARRLKMERQSLEAALIFFNQMSVWMYMPSVLPGVVFVDPQMPLDSINRIVQYSFWVGGGAIPGLVASECRLWKEGVVTSEMLKEEEFHACFVKGLFEADDALKLYEKLYIVAPLNEKEFIMPAMLQTVAEKDMERYVPAPSEHVAPLFLHFHMSRIAKGVFCSTHTCMRSKYGWTTSYTMVKRMKVPVCLFRNAVQLQHPKKPYEVTFIHAVTHFAVYLTAPQADLPSVCPEIRDMLLDAVDSAASAFRFKNSRASVAFQCPCDPDDAHTATPNEAHSNLVCSLTGKVCEGPLTPAQRVWLGATTTPATDSTATSSSSSATVPVSSTSDPQPTPSPSSKMDERPKLKDLYSFSTTSGATVDIREKVGSKFEALGLDLLEDDDGSLVDQIRISCHHVPADIVADIFKKWLRGRGKQPVTWRTLTQCLSSIGLSALASSIELAQCPCSPDNAHTPTPNEARSNLVCSLTGKVCEGPLTPAQRVWLGATTTPATDSTATSSSSATVPVSSTPDPQPTPSPSSIMGGTSDVVVELARDCGRDVGLLNKPITKDHLLDIKELISWKEVGPRLQNVSARDITDIDKDEKYQADKRRRLVDLWVERNGQDATYYNIIRAMLEARKRKEAEDVCTLLRRATSPEIVPGPTVKEKYETSHRDERRSQRMKRGRECFDNSSYLVKRKKN